jgi:nucleoside-diphosphate-sugar epimerase
MRAALGEASVRKIVLTSSEAAIAYGLGKQHFTEDDWTNLDGPAGRNDYFRSKTLAERLAWRLAADPATNPRSIPLAVVNPGFILGPTLVPWGRYSMETLKAQAEGDTPVLLDLATHIVDVRDCARMHIAIMNDPSTDGHRHFCFGMVAKMVEMSRIIQRDYAQIGLKPTTRVAPKFVLWALKFVRADAGSIYDKLGHANVYETKWPNVYRYQYADLAASLRASIDRMLELGWLRPRAEA